MAAKELGDKVRTLMHEHEVPIYRVPGLTVELVPGKEKIRITMGDEEDDDSASGPENSEE